MNIHFIGICGVAMSALATAFHKQGHTVTGSDKGFYPPVSTHLKEAGIAYYPGWHVEKMTANGDPDLVIVGNVAGSKNPEWLYVQEKKLKYLSYPEALAEFFIKENSIVCAGTYGKSTTTSLLTWMLKENGFDPSYMFGGLSRNDMPAAALTSSKYSIMEGDEYKSARWDNRAKFFHYKPTHLLLTAVVWDHADVYPTPESYDAAFIELASNMPQGSLIVASQKVYGEKPAVLEATKANIITYGTAEDNDYYYHEVTADKSGVSFKLTHGDTTYDIKTAELGDFMADNMTGAFAMAHQIGLAPEAIIASLQSFKSIKRRLEKRHDGEVVVFDDIAHSPKKAEAVLNSVKKVYDGKLIAIFEPNGGNRQHEAIPGYDEAFVAADTVIIPRLTRIKRDPNKAAPLDGQGLRDVIAKTHDDVRFIEDDEALINSLKEQAGKGDVIIFLGSHGFRGMIESLIKKM